MPEPGSGSTTLTAGGNVEGVSPRLSRSEPLGDAARRLAAEGKARGELVGLGLKSQDPTRSVGTTPTATAASSTTPTPAQAQGQRSWSEDARKTEKTFTGMGLRPLSEITAPPTPSPEIKTPGQRAKDLVAAVASVTEIPKKVGDVAAGVTTDVLVAGGLGPPQRSVTQGEMDAASLPTGYGPGDPSITGRIPGAEAQGAGIVAGHIVEEKAGQAMGAVLKEVNPALEHAPEVIEVVNKVVNPEKQKD